MTEKTTERRSRGGAAPSAGSPAAPRARRKRKARPRDPLTPRERGLLLALVSAGGAPLTRAELLERAWGWQSADEIRTKTVDVHVGRLRRKLAALGADPACVATRRWRGYAYDAGRDAGGAARALALGSQRALRKT